MYYITPKQIIVACLILVFSVDASTHIQQISLSKFIKKHPKTNIIQCTKDERRHLAPYPLYPQETETFPQTIYFSNIFIVSVPNGTVSFQSRDSGTYFFINNYFIKETQIKDITFFENQDSIKMKQQHPTVKLPGRLAIISHPYPYCYGHWFLDILSQLAVLEMNHIEYDHLCIPCHKKYMQDTLSLWGIDTKKIIPLFLDISLQADTLIFPTSVTNTIGPILRSNYCLDFLINYVRQKLVSSTHLQNHPTKYAEKIFISRKDARGKRAIPNEDEVFALFKERGFKRYALTSLSVTEQIALFQNAKTVVSFLGSGSTNIIFCKPGTEYIEICHTMVEATFFYLSQQFFLQYKTIDASTYDDFLNGDPWSPSAPINLEIIKNFLDKHPDV